MRKLTLFKCLGAFGLTASVAFATPVSLSIDASVTAKTFSPYIYGKNGGIAPGGNATSPDSIQRYKDAGFKILRLNDGNNGTKYNWEKKLSSHPDWYNNVYAGDNNWDLRAQEMSSKLPGVQGLFLLSMLGWVANNDQHNFNDGLYNNSAWTADVNEDWAGTPAITAAGERPTVPHDSTLYLEKRTPDQTLGIVDHFFGTQAGQLGLNQNQFLYWNMDNEPDIWNGTHSDVMPDTMSAEEFVQIYVQMALKARAKFPNIKLVGPVTTNEWQWYNWHSALVPYAGKTYSFMEFFIKRIGEEEALTGKRLLDVVDYHFYPDYKLASDIPNILQLHRIWFDKTYDFPKANGMHTAFSGTNKEYIFQRTRDWLNQYLPANHGVTLGLSECGAIEGAQTDASVIAAWYASQMGVFASAGDVEVFTPWSQYPGMFEAVHLFTRYAKSKSLPDQNDATNLVSAYPTLNAAKDSMTVILVNRDLANDQTITVNLAGFTQGGTWAPTFDLAYLSGETFKSESVNGIYKNAVDVANGTFTITVPKVSVTAVVLSTANPGTKPTFVARVIPSSSSTATSSSSSAVAGDTTVVWDYTLGGQVQQPSGTLGGWLYNFADASSTVTAFAAAAIATDKAWHVVYTAGASATGNWAGSGFSWGNTAAGANVSTIDLSAYTQVCVEYKSTVAFKAGISQPTTADATKSIGYMTATEVLPVAATMTTKCLDWSAFGAGTALNLAKQSAFQLQVGATADYTINKISLVKKAVVSSSSSTASVLTWDYTLGAQVKQPSGTLGGWLYTFPDPLSTITPITAATITTDKALHVVFTGVQSATQTYNYGGFGFNWGTTATGAVLSTVNLSAYSQICLDYKSTVGMRAGISQPTTADATKQIGYMSTADVLPIAATMTTKCLSWSDLGAGTALNLAKQTAFQLQVGATADFTIYKIALMPGTTVSSSSSATVSSSSVKATGILTSSQPATFIAKVMGSQLLLDLPNPGTQEIRLLDLQGHVVKTWSADASMRIQKLGLDNLRAGRYIVQVPQRGAQAILIFK